MMTYPDCQSPQ